MTQIVQCYDFQLCIPQDDWMLTSIRDEGVYEPWVIEAFRECCCGSHVLDVGANVGVFSIAAAKAGARKITAVDASPENAKLVAVNAALNGFDNINVYPVAASSGFGMVQFLRDRNSNKVLSETRLSVESMSSVDVAMAVPLDVLVKERVDIFKIDIEGHEFNALRGSKNVLCMRPKIFIEFSPDFARRGSAVEPQEFLSLFFDAGYKATILNRDMTRTPTENDVSKIISAYEVALSNAVTHIDLMMDYTC